MKSRALRFAFGILVLGIGLQFDLRALAVTVTNLNDSGPGSLRQSIADTPAGGTIDFAVTGNIVLASGQLVVTHDLTISGPGATNLTLSQNSTNRILLVSSGNVTISGLTIANGNCLTDDQSGGGIKNLATFTLRNCLITSNYADYAGGGVLNQGDLTVRESLIISNLAGRLGGGIANFYGGATTIIGSTICSNTVGPFGGFITAGGIHTGSNRYLVVSNSTVSGNQQYGIMLYGGGGGTVVVSSSTLANNQQGDIGMEIGSAVIRNSIIKACGGGFYTSEDYNLIYTDSFDYPSTFTGSTNHNIHGQDPKLGPLADNGGPTPTHALRFDSPAIDAGNSGSATADQRGLPRPVDDPNTPNADTGDGSDIGAYETDPFLKITGIEAAGEEIYVRFNSVLGRNYRLESEGNLDNSWPTVANNSTGAGSAVQTMNAGTSNLPRQFYRVKLLP
jgi:hypothetical protein